MHLKKIWLAAAIEQNSWGGVERSLNEIAMNLRSGNYHVSIYTLSQLPSCSYIHFAFKLALKYMFDYTHRPQVLIARSTDSFFCALLNKLFRLNTRIIIHNHGWEEYIYAVIESKMPRSLINNPTTWKARTIRFFLLRATVALTDYCMSGTLRETEYLKNKFPACTKKFIYIPNGITPPKTNIWVDSKTFLPCFLSIGPHTWKKNTDYTVTIFKKLYTHTNSVHLYCIGMNDVFLYAQKNKCIPNTTFINRVPFEQMDDWYATCPYLIISSRYEGGYPFVLLEALARGIIVFASRRCSAAEIIVHEQNGYLLTGTDIYYDCNCILQALTKTNRTIRLNAVQTARQFNSEHHVKKIEKLFVD